MHSLSTQQAALALVAAGVNDCEIARRLGVPRTTVRDWRAPRYERKPVETCWRPSRPIRFEPCDYTELLGLYLGDGYIATLPRTERLRIFLDARHAQIIEDTAALLRRCFPANRLSRFLPGAQRMVVLSLYNAHLSCVFPQTGRGKKHDRAIELEPWQHALVSAAPWGFIKGCIRSDGCVFVNRTGRYEYISYCFDNRSPEIRELFLTACRLVGVECRPSGNSVRVYRRSSVERMLQHVGIKS